MDRVQPLPLQGQGRQAIGMILCHLAEFSQGNSGPVKVPQPGKTGNGPDRRAQDQVGLTALARQLDGFVDGFKKPSDRAACGSSWRHGQAHRNAGVHERSRGTDWRLTRTIMAIKPSEQTIQPGKKMPLINDAVHQS